MSITILLADDHQLLREGLKALLGLQEDMEVVGEAVNGIQAFDLTRKLDPDVVIMDINMPEQNGIEASRKITKHCRGVKVLALSVHSDQNFVLEMLRAGASGYLLKDCALDELVLAIRMVMEDKYYLSPAITGTVLEDFLHDRGEPKSSLSLLTNREREVLQMIAEGKSTRDTAEALSISAKTVETHRLRLMNKLGLRNVADLTKFALREGLTTLDF
ncbi:response regulator transcription factor [bacterium]|nr:response regulator transcription factor [bacterium]MBU1674425.1 response regulator transcription factor [bacterium]